MSKPPPSSEAKELSSNGPSSPSESPAGAPNESARKRQLGRPKEVPSLALIRDSTRKAYYATYKDVFDHGSLDRKTKELIAIAAASITGCQGCLMGHIRKARAMGVKMEEIKEAVGVAFAVNAATVVDHTDVVSAMLSLPEE